MIQSHCIAFLATGPSTLKESNTCPATLAAFLELNSKKPEHCNGSLANVTIHPQAKAPFQPVLSSQPFRKKCTKPCQNFGHLSDLTPTEPVRPEICLRYAVPLKNSRLMPCSHPVKGQCLSTSADVLEGELPQPQMHCSFRISRRQLHACRRTGHRSNPTKPALSAPSSAYKNVDVAPC